MAQSSQQQPSPCRGETEATLQRAHRDLHQVAWQAEASTRQHKYQEALVDLRWLFAEAPLLDPGFSKVLNTSVVSTLSQAAELDDATGAFRSELLKALEEEIRVGKLARASTYAALCEASGLNARAVALYESLEKSDVPDEARLLFGRSLAELFRSEKRYDLYLNVAVALDELNRRTVDRKHAYEQEALSRYLGYFEAYVATDNAEGARATAISALCLSNVEQAAKALELSLQTHGADESMLRLDFSLASAASDELNHESWRNACAATRSAAIPAATGTLE